MDATPRELSTTAEVIDALGGISAVARLTSRKYSAAFNWKNFVKFPADTYVVMQAALGAAGCAAPASLWGMVAAPSTQPEQPRVGASAS